VNLSCLEIAKTAGLQQGKTAGNEIRFRCPRHTDNEPSLRVDTGKNCWFCNPCNSGGNAWSLAAWCADLSPEDKPSVAAWLKERGLLNGNGHHEAAGERRMIATYDYRNAAGELSYQVVRFEPKDFRQRRPDGNGKWNWSTKGLKRLPYHLPELAEAEYVFVVEGEKDVESLRKIGLTATCNSGGAGKWSAELAQYFRADQRVTTIPDNDGPGRDHAQQVAESLFGKVASLKILELAGLPDKGDVSDWLTGRDPEAAAEELSLLAEGAPEWAPAQAAPTTGAATNTAEFPQTDSGNAELFASCNAGRVLYDHRRNQWLLWAAHYWRTDSDGEIYRLAKESARERYRRAEQIKDLAERGRESKWAISSESRQKLEAALSLARSERTLADSGNGWNADPFLLAVGNGVIDLRAGTLRPGRPEDRINFHSSIDYNPAATCPRWLRFLEEVFDGNRELVDFIFRIAGYSASGDTREQVLFVSYGAGSNGKGILLNTLRRVMGDYGHNMPFTTLEQQDRGGIPNDLAAVVGRRFVTASETNQSARLNEARVKALTGCDPISARFLHGEWFTFQPVAKFWLAVNHRPRVSDDSFGFWRRVRIIPFLRQFTGAAADLRLDDKLALEMPGILAWLVRGCLAWQERGLDPPDCVKIATDEYRQDSDLLADFIAERCIVDRFRSASGSDLFKAYRAWAEGHGFREKEILGKNEFGRRMAEKFTKRRLTSGVFYEGVGLSM
jgi:putative DNA primase/helicase